MPTTKHCCYGLCNSDSRYEYKDYMKNVKFLSFPKPNADLKKCKRWVNACGRADFTWQKVSKYTYICTKHFMDPTGPTDMYPDPIPARYSEDEVLKLRSRKRKSLQSCASHANEPENKMLHVKAQAQVGLPEDSEYYPDVVEMEVEVTMDNTPLENQETQVEEKSLSTDIGTQTAFVAPNDVSTKLQIAVLKRENEYLRNRNTFLENKVKLLENKTSVGSTTKIPVREEHALDIESIGKDDTKMRFYTGLTVVQFLALWNFLCPAALKLSYWKKPIKNQAKSPSKRCGPSRKLSPKNELFLTLLRLRLGLLHQDIAYRFDISIAQVSTIVITWVKFMSLSFKTLMPMMMPPVEKLKKKLPPCFKMFKNTRCIIDCTEFFVQQASDFGKQGNLYSSYKSHPTYKVLLGISPNGFISFVSDVYEGSISDKMLVQDSKFLDLLDRGDIVMADRGFNVTDIMLEKGVILFKPPHLNQRNQLTPVEEAQTKMVAKLRIHVERAIERVKKYRLLQKIIPLSLEPIFSDVVFVCCCLVNFQEPLVK